MKDTSALKYIALAAMSEPLLTAEDMETKYSSDNKKRFSGNSTLSPSEIKAKKKRRKKNKQARKQRKKYNQ